MRVVNQVGVKLLKLFKLDEATLISESLLSQVLSAFVSYESLALSSLLFLPIFKDLLVFLFT
jgi:hypothetical protein